MPGVDLARALAVVGMFAAHMTATAELVWADPRTWSGLVDGRSSILFATTAGVSLALAGAGAGRPVGSDEHPGPDQGSGFDLGPGSTAVGPRTVPGAARIAARALLLWLLGMGLVLLQVPIIVILPAYGILFLLGIGLLRCSTRALFVLAGAVALVAPFVVHALLALDDRLDWDGETLEVLSVLTGWHYPFVLWTAFLAAGIGAGRLVRRAPVRYGAALLAAGVVLAGIGYGVIGPIGDRAALRPGAVFFGWVLPSLQGTPHSSGVGEALGSGGFALAVLGACVLLCTTRARWVLWPLRALGSMPLTAYVTHVLIWALWMVAHGVGGGDVEAFGGFRALHPFVPVTVSVLVGCSLWALLVGRGPLEAVVARLSAATDRLVRSRRTGNP